MSETKRKRKKGDPVLVTIDGSQVEGAFVRLTGIQKTGSDGKKHRSSVRVEIQGGQRNYPYEDVEFLPVVDEPTAEPIFKEMGRSDIPYAGRSFFNARFLADDRPMPDEFHQVWGGPNEEYVVLEAGTSNGRFIKPPAGIETFSEFVDYLTSVGLEFVNNPAPGESSAAEQPGEHVWVNELQSAYVMVDSEGEVFTYEAEEGVESLEDLQDLMQIKGWILATDAEKFMHPHEPLSLGRLQEILGIEPAADQPALKTAADAKVGDWIWYLRQGEKHYSLIDIVEGNGIWSNNNNSYFANSDFGTKWGFSVADKIPAEQPDPAEWVERGPHHEFWSQPAPATIKVFSRTTGEYREFFVPAGYTDEEGVHAVKTMADAFGYVQTIDGGPWDFGGSIMRSDAAESPVDASNELDAAEGPKTPVPSEMLAMRWNTDILGEERLPYRVWGRQHIRGDRHYVIQTPGDNIDFMPGVTTVLKGVMPKAESLFEWAVNKFIDWAAYKAFMDLASGKGSVIHGVVADAANGFTADFGDVKWWLDYLKVACSRNGCAGKEKMWLNEVQRSLISVRQWVMDYNVRFLMVEKALCAFNLGVAGQIDFVVEMDKPAPSGKGVKPPKRDQPVQRIIAIVDLKTGSDSDQYPAQLAMYTQMLIEGFPRIREIIAERYPVQAKIDGVEIPCYLLFPKTAWRKAPTYTFLDRTAKASEYASTQMGHHIALFKAQRRQPSTKTVLSGPSGFDFTNEGAVGFKTLADIWMDKIQQGDLDPIEDIETEEDSE